VPDGENDIDADDDLVAVKDNVNEGEGEYDDDRDTVTLVKEGEIVSDGERVKLVECVEEMDSVYEEYEHD
jgi:hypothetical protein